MFTILSTFQISNSIVLSSRLSINKQQTFQGFKIYICKPAGPPTQGRDARNQNTGRGKPATP